MPVKTAMPRSEEPLFVASNRLPYDVARATPGRPPKRNVGGLVNALEGVLAARGGSWVGWDGAALPSAGSVASALGQIRTWRTPGGVELFGVPLSTREVGQYYHGFANRSLWPLFHTFPDKAVFDADEYAAYRQVNSRFADLLMARARSGGRIWVHDYHLMLLPRLLRQRGFRGRIDFFLHIPFPSPEIFRILPQRSQLLEGLLGADTIAFHVRAYRDNFVAAAELLTEARAAGSGPEGSVVLEHPRGSAAALAVPVGIDVAEFERLAALPEVQLRARRIRDAHGNRRILFGADRLDYTKGIRERLRGVERFFLDHPESRGRVVLIQFVVPSRHQVDEYRQMKREIDREAGRINGEFGREGWVPVHYRYVALERQELIAYYRAADVALVTPLRDGMNLVAPEFAASRIDGDGVLLVSEFAGIAGRSPGGILVNPYDLEGCAASISRALRMPEEERRERMATLRREVRRNPSSRWLRRCLEVKAPRAVAMPGGDGGDEGVPVARPGSRTAAT